MSSARFEAATFLGVTVDTFGAVEFAGCWLPVLGCEPKQYIYAPCDAKILWFFTLLQKYGFGLLVCAAAGLPAATIAGNARTTAKTNVRSAHPLPSRSFPECGVRESAVRTVAPQGLLLMITGREAHCDQTDHYERPARTAPHRARSARSSLLSTPRRVKGHFQRSARARLIGRVLRSEQSADSRAVSRRSGQT